MSSSLLNELITATRWEHIYRGDESYVIKLDFKDRKRVHGLVSNGSNFYLSLPEYQDVPIAICMTDTYGSIHEYWCIGENLHRPSGKPSYISLNPSTGNFTRVHHWNGVIHNGNGPAKETGYLFGDSRAEQTYDPDPSYKVRRFKTITQEWIVHGSPRGAYEGISTASYENYTEYSKDGLIESPEDQIPSISGSNVVLSWDHRVQPPLGLYPKRLYISDLCEYHRGDFSGRTMASPKIAWSYGYERYDGFVQCTDWTLATFDQQLNLYDGRFWSEQDEFIAINQFDQIINQTDQT